MYRAVTRQIQVTVTPSFMEEESSPEKGRYFWAYTVEIVNLGSETVRLRSRYWHIRDGLGRVQEVRGDGVVGKQPRLRPGERFEYTSGCPLETPQGIMEGHYHMEASDGTSFEVEIPAFSLDSPHFRRVVH
ncbi:Co2+/Mg2+ efflux protein ApaG [Alsobacter sp. SYSU M60028]|uniref:Protein ApaG n=1 Tax=Alsobacter ponti TaxID=2962936 RepID=A0ABT1LHV4_9HYPH|nr:Co2+/Mg2+ efflux protein ApaG [Alsobacter ponti]MCP8941086.1 Co2+/Mg2+ efflux protein ApaG [Alsobacter ponti]